MKKEIACRELSWCPGQGEKEILQRITLQLEEGHMYAIIGPNGAGKSSLLRHVMRFLPLQSGELTLGGESIASYSRKALSRELAFVPQETAMDTDFTAYEIVMTGRNPYQKRFQGESRQDRQKVLEAMRFTNSIELEEQPFFQLSGGEAQRVVIARAMAQDTPWMLLDEPVASLDIRNQIEIMENLSRLNQEKQLSILMVLHDVNLAASYCDRVIMLKKGRVLYAGKMMEGLSAQRLQELYEIPFECLRTEDGRPLFYPRKQTNSLFSDDS